LFIAIPAVYPMPMLASLSLNNVRPFLERARSREMSNAQHSAA
jgi:hypothetical protein